MVKIGMIGGGELLNDMLCNLIKFISVSEITGGFKEFDCDIAIINEPVKDIRINSLITLINADEQISLKTNSQIISYGLSNYANVGVSSIADGNLVICIQKPFRNIIGSVIYEQEINIRKLRLDQNDLHQTLAAAICYMLVN